MPSVIATTISAALLFGMWLVLSGHYTPLLLTIGAISAVGCALIAQRMKLLDAEGLPLGILFRLPRIILWLAYEVLKSDLAVIRVILSPTHAAPAMLTVSATQKTVAGLVTYANFITLTPGTVSVHVDEAKRQITVHSLTPALADGLKSGIMDRKVARLEGRRA